MSEQLAWPLGEVRLRELYHDQSMTLNEIGERYDVDHRTVMRHMQRHGIERRGRGPQAPDPRFECDGEFVNAHTVSEPQNDYQDCQVGVTAKSLAPLDVEPGDRVEVYADDDGLKLVAEGEP